MKKEDIHLGDWQRLLIGQAPWEFLLEVCFRSLLIYLVFFTMMRILGKRMSAQLTLFELVIIIVLGAAISVPMEAPDKGILPGLIILACVLLFEKGLTYLKFRSYKTEVITNGKVSTLLKDGKLLLNEMESCVISRERLFSELRTQDIMHLGQIERVYLEAGGLFSIWKYEKEKPGLSILPDWDQNLPIIQPQRDTDLVCASCGSLSATQTRDTKCPACQSTDWKIAVKTT